MSQRHLPEWMNVPRFNGIEVGSGDNRNYQSLSTTGAVQVEIGKDTGYDKSYHPAIKAVRTQEVEGLGTETDGAEALAAIHGISYGSVDTGGQPVGVAGFAQTFSTKSQSNDDACGVFGFGRIGSGGTGYGIGGYFEGQTVSSTGKCTGAEIRSSNQTSTPGAWSSSGISNMIGMWITASGSADSAAAISVGNPNGKQFKVGLGFNAQVSGSVTGGVADTTIRDDGNATTSIDINGSHTTGIDLTGATLSSSDAIIVASNHRVRWGASGPTISSGTGSPSGVVTASIGSLYLRTDGGASTTLYVKESGTGSATGWVGK